ncbi:MAG: SAM hydrolase/SAM-dependent halogenase family protein, partial [Acidimicrobiales bacterium]
SVQTDQGDRRLACVGPDSGLLTAAALRAGPIRTAVVLDDPQWHLAPVEGAGATFAGRDVFAPVAAHICCGTALESLGTRMDPADLCGEAMREATVAQGPAGEEVEAEVVSIDQFGNAGLNVRPPALARFAGAVAVDLGKGRLCLATPAKTFAEVRPGGLALVCDSTGWLALCVNLGSAAAQLGLSAGDRLVLRPGGR